MLDKQKVRIVITDYDHCDTEKPMQITFSGLITTEIGDSFFNMTYTPAAGKIDLSIYTGAIRKHIFNLIRAGELELENFIFEIRHPQFTVDDVADQIEGILKGLRPKENAG